MGNDEQSTALESGSSDQQQADEDNGDGRKTTPKPEITDEHREKAKEMAKAYQDERPTVALPGTGHTVTGQAVVNWLDDEGKPKHGDPEDGGVTRSQVVGKTTEDEDEDEDGSKAAQSEKAKSDEANSDAAKSDGARSDEANSGDAEEEAEADAETAKELMAEAKKSDDGRDEDAKSDDESDEDSSDEESSDEESSEQVSSSKG